MLASIIESRLAIRPDPAMLVLAFFVYSFCGYVLECIVLTVEHKKLVINRGFVKRLPFCIIYGFGGFIGYALLSPLQHSWVALFIVGAIAATAFEYFVARLQLRFFGDFWWDYHNKPFNYKGILCLESTIGWGFAALVIIKFMHHAVVRTVSRTPARLMAPLAVALLLVYFLDFVTSARSAKKQANQPQVYQPQATENNTL